MQRFEWPGMGVLFPPIAQRRAMDGAPGLYLFYVSRLQREMRVSLSGGKVSGACSGAGIIGVLRLRVRTADASLRMTSCDVSRF